LWLVFVLQGAFCILLIAGWRRLATAVTPAVGSAPLTQITPAFNERRHLSLLDQGLSRAAGTGLSYILVDDGSTDGSTVALERLACENGARFCRLSENRGKAAALNAGLSHAETRDVLFIDADTTIGAAELQSLASRAGVCASDAVALNIEPLPSDRWLVSLQRAEYLYVLNFERAGLAGFGFFMTVPGAASIWRRDAILEAGGFSSRTVSEDTDMTLTLQARGGRITIVRDCTASTDCPNTFAALLRQRARWIWGNLGASYYHGLDAARRRSAATNRAPGIAAAVLSCIQILSYLVLTISGFRLAANDLGPGDAMPIAAILAIALARLWSVRFFLGSRSPGIIVALVQLTVIQAINLLAFWWGMLTGMPWRRYW
jgi:cellulose synthase/poly-beta-1,6-N-acetylglucosamine synthase-like glycosyltransferase